MASRAGGRISRSIISLSTLPRRTSGDQRIRRTPRCGARCGRTTPRAGVFTTRQAGKLALPKRLGRRFALPCVRQWTVALRASVLDCVRASGALGEGVDRAPQGHPQAPWKPHAPQSGAKPPHSKTWRSHRSPQLATEFGFLPSRLHPGRAGHSGCVAFGSADILVCRFADFPVGRAPVVRLRRFQTESAAGWKTRETAGWKACATEAARQKPRPALRLTMDGRLARQRFGVRPRQRRFGEG